MLFSHIASFFFVTLTFGLVSSASPVVDSAVVSKRQDTTDIATVFNNLKASTDSILPQIDALVNSGSASENNISPLINQLTASFNTARVSLIQLNGRPGKSGPSKQDIAKLIAEIIVAVTETLDRLLKHGAHIPTLELLLIGIDVAVNEVLAGVEILVVGALELVSSLVVGVAVILQELAFSLTLAALGL